jgi:ABC-2 type transport system permease protein
MNELGKLGTVIKYEFQKHIRRKRLWVILALALVAELAVIILVPVLTDGYPDNVMIMASMLTVGPMMAGFGAIFFAGDAIAGEFEHRTGFMLLTNPVKKQTIWFGKYIAGGIAVVIVMLFSYIVSAVALLGIYGEVPFEMFRSLGQALLYAMAALSVTFFFSSISKGSMGATVITLVFIFVISGIVESVLAFTGNDYWFLISAGGDSISTVYGGMELFMGGYTGGGGPPANVVSMFETADIGMTSIGMVIYLVAGLVLSIWIAGRRQLA